MIYILAAVGGAFLLLVIGLIVFLLTVVIHDKVQERKELNELINNNKDIEK